MQPTKYRMEIDDHTRGHQLDKGVVDHILWEVRKTGDSHTVTYYKAINDWGSIHEVLWYSHEIESAVKAKQRTDAYHQETLKQIRGRAEEVKQEFALV